MHKDSAGTQGQRAGLAHEVGARGLFVPAHEDFLSQLTGTFYARKWTFMSTYESFSKSAKECRTVGGFRALDGPVASLPPTVHDFLARPTNCRPFLSRF